MKASFAFQTVFLLALPILTGMVRPASAADDSFIRESGPDTTNSPVVLPLSEVPFQMPASTPPGTNNVAATPDQTASQATAEVPFFVNLDTSKLEVDPIQHPDYPHYLKINDLFATLQKRLPNDIYKKDYRYVAISLGEILDLYKKATVASGNSEFTENYYLLVYQYYDSSYSLDKDRKTNLKEKIVKADAAVEAIIRAHGWTVIREKGRKPFVQPPLGMTFSKPTAQSLIVNTERLLPQDVDATADIGLSSEEIAFLKTIRLHAIRIRDQKGGDSHKVIDYAGRHIIDLYDNYGVVLDKIKKRVQDNLATEIKEAPAKIQNQIEALKKVKQYGREFGN